MFATEPRKLFIIDGLGALLSAFLLGVVLVRFESIFGIPASALYLLASFPLGFVMYDAISYRIKGRTAALLKGIAILNLLYCGLSLSLALYHSETITMLGWAYILGEVGIIILLAILEIRASHSL